MRGQHWVSIFRPGGFQFAEVSNTRPVTVSVRARVYLLAAVDSFSTAFRLKTTGSATSLRRSLSDQPKMPEHHAFGDGHEAIAVLADSKDGDLDARAVSR